MAATLSHEVAFFQRKRVVFGVQGGLVTDRAKVRCTDGLACMAEMLDQSQAGFAVDDAVTLRA